ncbi:MAG: bifunctional phosphoribosylaminoimidazolecarboxamide formyltransferase/IMP cyclohydrolase [Ilumatobacteraceae bacterium]
MARRALISVYDKTGVVDLARSLVGLGWEIVSSGGTARALADAGLPVTDVAELTGFPPVLGHRVVTLHPAVHAGLLADLDLAEHRDDLERMGIAPISLAVVNLYPFSSSPGIELIDVGGPTMVRAAAKNYAHVAVVTDPSQYESLVEQLRANDNVLSDSVRRRLARDAFAHTAAYDAAIVTWFDETDHAAGTGSTLPSSLHLALVRAQELRYGENPHQAGARYRIEGRQSWWDHAVQHGGKELSYLNLFDTEAAWRLVNSFTDPGVVVVKHANPCGVAVASNITDAYVRANACDPVSAFGGIVAANRPVTVSMAEALAPVFSEVVVAPGYEPDALELLTSKKNLRVLSAPKPIGGLLDMRSIDGGLLVQEVDPVSVDRSAWRVVTASQPDSVLWDDIVFAWQVCAAVSSNAIVLAKDLQAFGIGAGQQNRLDSARIASERAAGRATGGVCASDAFFPFRDGLDAVAAAGVRAVVQPGGSVRDEEVIAAANEHGIVMVFTGERHFRH